MAKQLNLNVRVRGGGVQITASGWARFQLGPMRCAVTLDGRRRVLRLINPAGGVLQWRGPGVEVHQTFKQETRKRVRASAVLHYTGRATTTFDHIDLLTIDAARSGRCDLGRLPNQVRLLEQSAHYGQVRSVGQILTGVDGRLALDGAPGRFVSNTVTVAYSPADRCGLLIGFESFNRWHGRISGGSRRAAGQMASSLDNVDRPTYAAQPIVMGETKVPHGRRLSQWSIGFPGGGVRLDPGETLALETFTMETGRDPFDLLDRYALRVAKRCAIPAPPKPFVNWCSWYPYRLGVSEQNMLATARAAKARGLDILGLRFIQVDLGWQKDNTPTYAQENERFSRGLKWLSRQIEREGFELGAWGGFTCVSDRHPVFRKHPDWLIHGDDGKPAVAGQWFWQPHFNIYSLDPTHPGAVKWIREYVASLSRRGVRYMKWDFGSNLTSPGRHHNPRMAASSAVEAIRGVCEQVRDAFGDGVIIDCTGTEIAGLGLFPMNYANADTGNTGAGFGHLRKVYAALATHLYKNHRWALLQPSCLVVGLPGTLEEARVRATATFLTGGHVDIGDDLTTLPESRWQILNKVLPPNDVTARAIDLFHPVRVSDAGYVASCQGEAEASQSTTEPQGAQVWHARMDGDWDTWDLVAVMNLAEPTIEASGVPCARRFEVPFEWLGLRQGSRVWAHELWSNQFLGEAPVKSKSRGAYRHPGDAQALINDGPPGVLDLTFHGPAVKLLVLRRPRRHPWPMGTTFHLSGGRELAKVQWNRRTRTLSGELHRPAGEAGHIVIAGVRDDADVKAYVDGRRAAALRGAMSSILVPIATQKDITRWRVRVG